MIRSCFHKNIGGLTKFRILPALTLSCLGALILLNGCGESDVYEEPDYSVQGERDNTPEVLIPRQEEKRTIGNEDVTIDLSSMEDGYFSARYTGDSRKVKLQLTNQKDVTYTYNLKTDGTWCVYPFSNGDGAYTLGVYSNIKDTMYATVFSEDLDVRIGDDFAPFLYPNEYVWFTDDTRAVSVSSEVCRPCNTDLEAIANVYNYVVNHVSYDWEEAKTVQSDYIPDVDEVLDTGKGICFDYASLMASMLRSQRIPTRMEIGYAGTAYHAWISTYVPEIGWVNGIIQFDGTDWSLMDPTFASTKSSRDYKNFIGDGENYQVYFEY